VAGSCEHCNKLSGSETGEKFLDQLGDYQLLKKDSAPWRWLVGWLVGWLPGK
jgi:hypothetical protein